MPSGECRSMCLGTSWLNVLFHDSDTNAIHLKIESRVRVIRGMAMLRQIKLNEAGIYATEAVVGQ